ncbi:YbaB/EbfC family nucleoid-associated protein [Mangrovihabitans endophyticus]|uniref:YbaB/EbfC DNA-binding family protein n=1 Tax=Mangrovihabitans endophyticus TaxID=1751298 RepID=A0A8J3BZ39_9ACTN|nr:YbaB/EbfC family nucleoid-associated protein [Mangrovihabitans endophyticus]GGK86940.1 hypothetical protein GCM10012284_21370 [Mangrovihabitans endophyticus]
MFDGRDLDDAERLVDEWQAGIDERAARTRELSAQLGGLTAEARSDDGLVTVAVNASGTITRLELAEEIRQRPADETARKILGTLHAAQSALLAQATTATEEALGADSPTAQAIIASYAARQTPVPPVERQDG